MCDSTVSLVIPDECMQLALKELSTESRRYLARHLDGDTCGLNADFVLTNWTGLAEIINVDYQSISQMEQQTSPTLALLEHYQQKAGSTVKTLWSALLKLERYDIFNDDFGKLLERDLKIYNMKQSKQNTKIRAAQQAIQVPKVSSNVPDIDQEQLEANYNETQTMVVGDVESGQTTYFDGFISYCQDDFPFVMEMVRQLEEESGLKLCISARDLLPGVSEHKITAAVIANRCRKVILVMSPAYLKSAEFDFQCKVALSLSPGARRKIIIPILYKFVRVPIVLKHVMMVDYTQVDYAPWFWQRLKASVKEAPTYRSPKADLDRLSQLELDIKQDTNDGKEEELFTFESQDAFFCYRYGQYGRQDKKLHLNSLKKGSNENVLTFQRRCDCHHSSEHVNSERDLCETFLIDGSELTKSSCRGEGHNVLSQGQTQMDHERFQFKSNEKSNLEASNRSAYLSYGEKMISNESQVWPEFSRLLTGSVKSSCELREDSYELSDFVINN